jgi:hypothetical protein
MNPAGDTKTIFKFLNAKLSVKRIRANPQINLAHEETLKTDLARYNMTIVEIETFTFFSGPNHSRSIRLLRGGYLNVSCSP